MEVRADLILQRAAQWAVTREDYRCGSRRDRGDHQEEIAFLHSAPETAKPSGDEIAEKARRQPDPHGHREIARWSDLGDQRQAGWRQIKLA